MALDVATLAVRVDTTDLKKGEADLDKFAKKADRAEKEVTDFGRATDRAGSKVSRFGGSVSKMSGAMRAGRGNIQNVAFQVGDFATQVGAGTSASVALGQQLPQLLGGFGALGAVMGAVVAIGVPLAASLIDLGESAAETERKIGELKDAISSLDAAQKAASMTNPQLAESYGMATAAARELLAIEQRRIQLDAEGKLAERLNLLSDTFDAGIMEFLTLSPAAFGEMSDQARALGAHLGASHEELKGFLGTVEAIGQAEGAQAQADAVRAARDAFIEMAGGIEAAQAAAPELLATFTQMEDSALRLQAISVSQEGIIQAQEAAARQMLATLQQEADMQRLVVTYGEDSLQVTEARVAAERAAFEETLATMQVSEELKEELRAAWDNANGIASVNMAGNIGAAASEAARLAENMGISLALAQRIAAMGPQGIPATNEKGLTYSGRGGDPRQFGDVRTAEAEEFLANWKPPKVSRGGGGGGGGGGGISEAQREAEAIQNVIESLREEIEMVGLSEQARRTMQEVQRAGVDLYSAEGQQIADLVEELTKLEQRQEGLTYWADTISESFTDAFMDAITGAKSFEEAFRNMAASILANLAEMIIQQTIYNALAGAFGITGKTSSPLSVLGLPGFADGTSFAPGGMAIVGEKGPEIVDLPRGSKVTPNHKLGQAEMAAKVDVINVFDPSIVGQYLNTAEGQNTLINVMRMTQGEAA